MPLTTLATSSPLERDHRVTFGMLKPNGETISCWITLKALTDLVEQGGTRTTLGHIQIFQRHRPLIEAKASKLYDAGQIRSDGSVGIEPHHMQM